MSEMWNSSGDDGSDDWSSDLFPPHWWRSSDGHNNQAFSEGKGVPELVLTIDTIVNLLRVISVCPPSNLASALVSGEHAVTLEERARLIMWCESLYEQLATH
jgi:hypothetical protein